MASSIRNQDAATGRSDRISSGETLSLSDREFDEIRAVIKNLTGINMGASKRQLIYRRLQTRLKATGTSTFRDYLELLERGDATEREAFSNAVTTNLTSFFREKHHFDFLAKTIIPDIVAKKGSSSKRLRIWSAGCSTGEEPYSIAITLKEAQKDLAHWDVKLLCTDLDSNVLGVGKTGIYAPDRVEKIPQAQLRRWFTKSREQDDGRVKMSRALQDLMTFKQLNLMDDWPMRGPFDVIFCRNVVIYFDKPTQRVLMDRYANILADDGYLILGHSESLFNVSDRFALLGNTIYRKSH